MVLSEGGQARGVIQTGLRGTVRSLGECGWGGVRGGQGRGKVAAGAMVGG